MPPVDLEALPGIGDICGGALPQMLTHHIELAMAHACDPRNEPEPLRVITLKLGCRPDAADGSVLWGVEKISLSLAGARRPKTSRVVFDRREGLIRARAIARAEEPEPEPEPMDDSSPIALGVAPEVLVGGALQDAWRIASIEIYLDVSNRRKKTAALRTVEIKIAVNADASQTSPRIELSSVKVGRAPGATKPAQRLYNNRRGSKLVAGLEPDATLPVEPTVQPGKMAESVTGQQSAIDESGKPN